MFKTIAEFARMVADRISEYLKGRKEKCDIVAKYLVGISDVLQQLAEGVKAGQVPQDKIAELATYAEILPQTIGRDLRLMGTEELTRRLKEASDPAALTSRSKKRQTEGIEQLQSVAGLFKALGESCRVHY